MTSRTGSSSAPPSEASPPISDKARPQRNQSSNELTEKLRVAGKRTVEAVSGYLKATAARVMRGELEPPRRFEHRSKYEHLPSPTGRPLPGTTVSSQTSHNSSGSNRHGSSSTGAARRDWSGSVGTDWSADSSLESHQDKKKRDSDK